MNDVKSSLVKPVFSLILQHLKSLSPPWSYPPPKTLSFLLLLATPLAHRLKMPSPSSPTTSGTKSNSVITPRALRAPTELGALPPGGRRSSIIAQQLISTFPLGPCSPAVAASGSPQKARRRPQDCYRKDRFPTTPYWPSELSERETPDFTVCL